ncbi:phage tail protein [Clostridium sp. C2-6-12]|uniref:phage tail protein n=1 Tax=Clostridium sp. C2-6-12 TaxID=2698832 RepID=UPI00136F86FE|nr:phage tail protein [Clostridium sp. C2-6-12]
MIRLFDAKETNFEHNKWVLSDAKVEIVESVDSIFDMELEYPLNDRKNLSQYLVKGNIIKSNIYEWDPRGDQLFEIRTVNYSIKKGEKIVKVYAQAIGRAKLSKNFIMGCRVPAGSTRKQAIQKILDSCIEPHGFHAGNLDTNTNTNINLGLEEETGAVINYLDTDYMSPLKAFLGDKQSVQSAYGGEIVYNNFEINMVDERGADHNFIIKSGKNLQELQQEISDMDNDNFATALIMKSSDGIYLPNNEVIYSPNAATLGNYYKVIVCDDVTAVDGSAEAIDIVYAQLRERAAKKFADGIDKLPINNIVNFIQLTNTEEYKKYSGLFTEKCEIGNNVTIEYEKANITAMGRVVQIKFNPNLNNERGKIIEVTIGDRKKKSMLDAITDSEVAAIELNNKHNDNKKKIKQVKKYTDDTKQGLIKYIGETATGILLEVKKADDSMGARIELTEKEILSTVKKDEFGSMIKQHFNEILMAVFDGTNHTVTLNGDGLSVGNGAFTVRDNNGNIVFRVNLDNVTGVRDLSLSNEAYVKGSAFYRSLMGMEEVWLQKLGVGQLAIDEKDFYITHNDQGGYDLENYVNTLCYKMLESQGLI